MSGDLCTQLMGDSLGRNWLGYSLKGLLLSTQYLFGTFLRSWLGGSCALLNVRFRAIVSLACFAIAPLAFLLEVLVPAVVHALTITFKRSEVQVVGEGGDAAGRQSCQQIVYLVYLEGLTFDRVLGQRWWHVYG